MKELMSLGVAMGLSVVTLSPCVAYTIESAPKLAGDREMSAAYALKAVCSKLRDCDSAKFTVTLVHRLGTPGTGHVRDANGGYSVCGTVNAKNGFGGYAGAERFVFVTFVKRMDDINPSWILDDGTWAVIDTTSDDDDDVYNHEGMFNRQWKDYCW